MSLLLRRSAPTLLRRNNIFNINNSLLIQRAMSTISSAIIEDHRELESYYQKYCSNKGNANEQQKWLNQFTWELARHSIGEELVVYPLFEDKLGAEGKSIADQDRKEHQKAKDILYELQNMNAGEAKTDAKFAELMKDLREHIKHEEEQQLPKLEKAMNKADSSSVAKSFDRTKMFVPTRSHPSAPDKPPFETVAGLMAAPMDKLGDLFRSFPTQEELQQSK